MPWLPLYPILSPRLSNDECDASVLIFLSEQIFYTKFSIRRITLVALFLPFYFSVSDSLSSPFSFYPSNHYNPINSPYVFYFSLYPFSLSRGTSLHYRHAITPLFDCISAQVLLSYLANGIGQVRIALLPNYFGLLRKLAAIRALRCKYSITVTEIWFLTAVTITLFLVSGSVSFERW